MPDVIYMTKQDIALDIELAYMDGIRTGYNMACMHLLEEGHIEPIADQEEDGECR